MNNLQYANNAWTVVEQEKKIYESYVEEDDNFFHILNDDIEVKLDLFNFTIFPMDYINLEQQFLDFINYKEELGTKKYMISYHDLQAFEFKLYNLNTDKDEVVPVSFKIKLGGR